MTRRDRSSGSVEGHHVVMEGVPQPKMDAVTRKNQLKTMIKQALTEASECNERACWLHLKLAFVALNRQEG